MLILLTYRALPCCAAVFWLEAAQHREVPSAACAAAGLVPTMLPSSSLASLPFQLTGAAMCVPAHQPSQVAGKPKNQD